MTSLDINNLGQFLPKFIPDESCRNTKYWAFINLIAPILYTCIVSNAALFASDDHGVVKTSNVLVGIYIFSIIGSMIGINVLKIKKPGFKEWWLSPTDETYNNLSETLNQDDNVTENFMSYNTMVGSEENVPMPSI